MTRLWPCCKLGRMGYSYRSRDLVVTAFQWSPGGRADRHDLVALTEWASQADLDGRRRRGEDTLSDVTLPISAISVGRGRFRVEIAGVDGPIRVRVADFVVCMPDGAFVACSAEAFAALFALAGAS